MASSCPFADTTLAGGRNNPHGWAGKGFSPGQYRRQTKTKLAGIFKRIKIQPRRGKQENRHGSLLQGFKPVRMVGEIKIEGQHQGHVLAGQVVPHGDVGGIVAEQVPGMSHGMLWSKQSVKGCRKSSWQGGIQKKFQVRSSIDAIKLTASATSPADTS